MTAPTVVRSDSIAETGIGTYGAEAGAQRYFGHSAARLDPLGTEPGAALRGALAIGPPAPSDRFAVPAAVLSMLSTIAEDGPLLAIVDDAPETWGHNPPRQ